MQNRTELAARRSTLSPARRAVLEQRLRSLAAPVSAQAAAVPVAAVGPSPVSFEQQALWLFEQIEPGTGFYTIFYCLKLVGNLDRTALERSLTEVIRRHEILRTNIDAVDGAPMQFVAAPAPAHIEFEDARHRPLEQRQADIAAAALAERWRPFDLAHDKLLRLKLMQFEDDLHVAFLSVHHIVSDGWSMRVLIGEIAHFYDAHLVGRRASLPDLPRQYRDYAIWQRDWIKTQPAERQLAYWKKRLDGASAVLDLPFDRLRSRVGNLRGDQYPIEVSAPVVDKLKTVFQRHQATLFMGLLAAYCVLLHRLTGQNDILVGCPVANRDQQQSEELIGCFANVLPIRTKINPGQTFGEILESVRDGILDDFDHQNLPFDKLAEQIKGAHKSGYVPRIQTTLVMQPPEIELMTESLTISQIPGVGEQRINLDLSLSLNERGSKLLGHWRFNPSLFDRTTIARFTAWLQTLLESIATNPQSRISDLTLLDDAERRNLLAVWNDTASAYDSSQCLHELFGEQAAATPDAVAVVYEDQLLTYRELDRRSNLLAHHLRDLGIGPEKVVGLCVDRSPEMVVGLLGILKAGGAYLPLDPAYPARRISHMLAETRAQVLVTQADLVDRVTFTGTEVVDLDADVPNGPQADNAPASGSRPDNLAYVIYTSGSTGRPKGVMIRHQGVINYLTFLRRHYRLSAEDAVLQVSSISFDPSVRDIFAPLLAGARLVIPSELDVRSRKLLHEIVGRCGVSRILSITPSLLRQIVGDRTQADWPTLGLRTLLPCGEALDYDLCRQIRGSVGEQVEIVNQYGPTECTMSSSYFAVDDSPELSATVPLGRPIFNVRFYGLDDELQLTPVGVAGELYIAGDGVSRGYFGRPGLTAERFLPDPFGDGERIYRTGDVVRRRPDGDLEFVARRDHQVKVRGYRVELGEIEAALRSCAGVAEVVVLAREDEPGAKQLVAYVVAAAGGPALATNDLRSRLREVLPDYMIPSAFVTLNALPVTANGKLDRKALPAPRERADDGLGLAPRTAVEQTVADIWCDVLRRQRVGADENFFDLGGHSLLATQVITRVCELFNVDLPLRAAFEAPTVVELSDRIERALREGADLSIAPLTVQLRPARVPLSYAQERLWVLEQLEATGAAYHIPSTVRLNGTLDVGALERSFTELVRRHDMLRTRFAAVDGSPEQVIDAPGQFRLETEELEAQAAEEREAALRRRVAEIAGASLDLERGPLFRAVLLKLSAEEHVVVVVMHHIISDAWSMGVLIRELGALYRAFVLGEGSLLPQLPVQYADYALWQRDWLKDEILQRQVAYWKKQMSDAPAALELAVDRARPAMQSFRGAARGLALSLELTRALSALARAEGATLFMVLLAAFAMVLSRWSGQRDVVVGTPIAGRTHRQTEGLIGLFVNMLALRTDLSADPSFRALVGRAKETALGAYAHQDLPFEKLVEELQPVRDLGRHPIFQALLVLQNVPHERLELPGLQLRRVDGEHVTSKLDLSLYLDETEQGLRGHIEYAFDLFEDATIARFADHFVRVLNEAVVDPNRRLSELTLLSAQERERLLVESNANAIAYPRESCVHELFAEQAERTPEAVAVALGTDQLSYRELDRRANRLAHHLRALGVGPDVIVGLCVERSLEMPVGLLGILKAGGAYLPLDPGYPPERLGYMMADAHAKVLVTERLPDRVLPPHDAIVVRLDADAAAIASQPEEAPPRTSEPDHLAYLIYTSGSTGKPKGVMGHHRGVVSRLHWDVGDGASEVYGQKTTLSFIDAIWEIFMPLIRGGRTVLMPEAAVRDPDALIDELSRQGVTRLVLVPSLLRAAVENVERLAERLTALNYIVSSGEALPADLAEQCLRALPAVKLINIYGTSEFWDATWYDSGAGAGARGIPLGRTLPNMRVYVLDEGLQPSPIGVPGDLYVGGAGLARGYLGRPGLTAERFIPHPFGEAGERLYRAGDVARWRTDGNLEFFGRGDHQVKVRGYRIELGEVENALRSCEGVRQAAVVAREDKTGDKRLIAYLVLEPEQRTAAASGDLRARVRHHLPEHMIPSAFIELEALPLTPSGKLDRNALPMPEIGGLAAYVAPHTPAEETLAGIWSEVLGTARVGVNENFFEAGGHSLLLIRLHRRISARFDVKVPLVALFQYPTIRSFAIYLSGQASDGRVLDESRDRGARRRQSNVRRAKSDPKTTASL